MTQSDYTKGYRAGFKRAIYYVVSKVIDKVVKKQILNVYKEDCKRKIYDKVRRWLCRQQILIVYIVYVDSRHLYIKENGWLGYIIIYSIYHARFGKRVNEMTINKGAVVKVKCPKCGDEVLGLTEEGNCRECLEYGD